MSGMKKWPVILLFMVPAPLWAAWGDFVFIPEEKNISERELVLPPYPKPENLLKFDAGTLGANQHWLDTQSIQVGEDDIIRYTLVIKTQGGASNISYEGLRCKPAERKLYAYGRENQTWSEAQAPKWQNIDFNSTTSYHKTLHREIFCPEGIGVRNAAEAVKNLRRVW